MCRARRCAPSGVPAVSSCEYCRPGTGPTAVAPGQPSRSSCCAATRCAVLQRVALRGNRIKAHRPAIPPPDRLPLGHVALYPLAPVLVLLPLLLLVPSTCCVLCGHPSGCGARRSLCFRAARVGRPPSWRDGLGERARGPPAHPDRQHSAAHPTFAGGQAQAARLPLLGQVNGRVVVMRRGKARFVDKARCRLAYGFWSTACTLTE
jgi:hypothetical protein